jgi:hypothetical protein
MTWIAVKDLFRSRIILPRSLTNYALEVIRLAKIIFHAANMSWIRDMDKNLKPSFV